MKCYIWPRESKQATFLSGKICRKNTTFLIVSLVHNFKSVPLIHLEYLCGGSHQQRLHLPI